MLVSSSLCRGSLPSRERGLKHHETLAGLAECQVAPLAGAWIETRFCRRNYSIRNVAPLAGAWIETLAGSLRSTAALVAPLAGAWIETMTIRFPAALVNVAPLAGAWIETEEAMQPSLIHDGRSPRGSVD